MVGSSSRVHDAAAISTTMLMAEATACFRDLLASDGSRLYEPVRLRLEAGLFISAADYLRAQQGRAVFDRAARRLLEDVDLLAGPTEPVTAPPLLQQQVLAGEHEVGTVAALTQYTRPYNITGFHHFSNLNQVLHLTVKFRINIHIYLFGFQGIQHFAFVNLLAICDVPL